MPIDACPGCNRQVSDFTPNCPHCGGPVTSAPRLENVSSNPERGIQYPASSDVRTARGLVTKVLLVLALACFGYWAYRSASISPPPPPLKPLPAQNANPPEFRKCVKCGTQLKPGTNYCITCGAKLEASK